MRKTQVALAALALVASTASMAEVAIGGYVEAAVQNATGSGTQLIGGGLDINKLYFAASEEVDGIKAGAFALVRFESINGGLTRPGTSAGGDGTFFEIAHVNLGSAQLGTIELGRTVDSYWGNGVAGFDVTGGSNLGSAVSSVLNLQTSKVFVDNSVHYVSPNINGLTVAMTHVMQDSTTGATIANATKGDASYTANYAINGVRLGAGYMKSDLAKGYFFAAGYDFGFANVNAIYQDVKNVSSGNGITNTGVNAAIPLVGALSATASYYKDSGDTADFLVGNGSSYQAGLLYAVSKRTRVYANYQKTSGDLGLNIGLSSPNAAAVAGSSVTFGVGHSF